MINITKDQIKTDINRRIFAMYGEAGLVDHEVVRDEMKPGLPPTSVLETVGARVAVRFTVNDGTMAPPYWWVLGEIVPPGEEDDPSMVYVDVSAINPDGLQIPIADIPVDCIRHFERAISL